jgi:hypothetical protein
VSRKSCLPFLLLSALVVAQTGDVRVQRAIRILEARGLLSQAVAQYRTDPARATTVGDLLIAAADVVEIVPGDPTERLGRLSSRMDVLDSAFTALPDDVTSGVRDEIATFYNRIICREIGSLRSSVSALDTRAESLSGRVSALRRSAEPATAPAPLPPPPSLVAKFSITAAVLLCAAALLLL